MIDNEKKSGLNYPIDLSKDIEFSPGAIVSKNIVKKNNGNITLFSLDKGQSLSEHISPFEAFVLVLNGKLKFKIGSEYYILTGGQYIVMPANVPHGLEAEDASRMLLVMIKEH